MPLSTQVDAGDPAERAGLARRDSTGTRRAAARRATRRRGGLHQSVRRSGRHERVLGHVDAPGQRGVDAVVAVAGGQAADAADAVADRGRRGGEVQHAQAPTRGPDAFEAVGAGALALPDSMAMPASRPPNQAKPAWNQCRKPRRTSRGWRHAGQQICRHGRGELGGVLQLMPGLGADDAGERDQGDDVQRVGVDAVAHEVRCRTTVAQTAASQSSRPKVPSVQRANVDIGIHGFVSSIAVALRTTRSCMAGRMSRSFPQRHGSR